MVRKYEGCTVLSGCVGDHPLPLLLVLTVCFAASESQPAMCSVYMERDSRAAILTCDFAQDMQIARATLFVRQFDDYGDVENLAECTWHEDGYWCTLPSDGVSLYNKSNNNSNNNSNNSNSNNNNNNNNNISISIKVSQHLSLRLDHPRAGKAVDDEVSFVCLTDQGPVVPAFCALPEIEPPKAPCLHVTRTAFTSVELSWDPGYDGGSPLLGFELNYTKEDKDWHSVQLNAENTTYTVTGLLCGTLYHFTMRSFNAVGYSSDPPAIKIRTNGSVPVMSAESGLVTETNVTSVTLDFSGWEADDGCPVKFFSVKYRRIGDEEWSVVNDNISSDVREMKVGGLKPDTQYILTVTACNDAGNASLQLPFITLPVPPPDETKTEKTEETGADKTQTTAVIAAVVTAVSVTLLIVGFLLCWNYIRRRGARNNTSTPIDNDTEMESTADSQTVLMANKVV